VYYDFTGDQIPDRTAWVAPDDGLLAYDANHDGSINQRSEFVFTDLAPNAQTDMEAVRFAFDTNGDAWLSTADQDWAAFGVWQDANGNGINDAGEFSSLDSWGIARISLQTDGVVSTPVDGVVSHGTSVIEWVDGRTSAAGDVGFGFEPAVTGAVAQPLQTVADSVNHSLDTALTDSVSPSLAATSPPTVVEPLPTNVYARLQQTALTGPTTPTTAAATGVASPATGPETDSGLADSILRLREAAARAANTPSASSPEPTRNNPTDNPATGKPTAQTAPGGGILSGEAYKNMLLGHDAHTGPITPEQPTSPHVMTTVPETAPPLNWQSPLDDLSHTTGLNGVELHQVM
jgi:hypothetical protein